MGFPKITYGTSLDLIVDFDQYLRNGSGVEPFESIISNQALSGIEKERHLFSQNIMNLRLSHLSPKIKTQLDDFKLYARDGSTFTVELDRDLGAYIGFEGKKITMNDGTAGTLTRAAGVSNNATYIDYPSGLIVIETNANTGRFPAGKFGGGVIIEGARTNLITNADDFTAVGWVKVNIDVSGNTAEKKDPLGNNLADKLTAAGATRTATWDTATARNAADDAAAALWVACPSGTVDGILRITDDSPQVLAGTSFTATPEWQRVYTSFDNSATLNNWGMEVTITNDTDILYVYNAQLEIGSSVLFSSQDILNSGADLTRNTEKLIFTTDDINFNTEKGTIGLWFKPEWTPGSQPLTTLFAVDTSGSGDRFMDIEVNASGVAGGIIKDALGATVTSPTIAGSGKIVQNDWNFIAFTWDSTSSNVNSLYLGEPDGTFNSNTATHDAFSPSIVSASNVSIGSFHDGGSPAYCIIDEVFILKEALTESQVRDYFNSANGYTFSKNKMTCRLADKNAKIISENGGLYNAFIPCKEVLT